MSHVRAIARQTAVLTAAQVVSLLVSLIGTILVTRALGPDGRAVYAWLLTLVGMAIQLALFATPSAVRAIAVRKPARLPATLAFLCVCGVVLTLPLVAYVLVEPTIGRVSARYLALAWMAVPITATTSALFTLLQIEARLGALLAVQVVPKILQGASAAILFVTGHLHLLSAILLFVVTAFAEFVLTLAFLRRQVDGFRPSVPLVREVLRLLEAGWVSSLALYAVPRLGLIVLGASAPFEVTGRYSVALTLQEASMVAPVALGGVLITHVGLHGEPTRLTRRRAALRVLAAALLICAVAALVAPAFVAAAFGAAFASAASSFRMLLPAVLLATFYQLCQPLLYATRSAIAIGTPALGAFAVALATALLAIPSLGAGGAVLSNVLGYVALAALAFWFVGRRPSP